MDQSERRRERLGRLLDLAQTYRGWSRRELAAALGRDPTKLVPASGVPKLDLVIDLARVLDWALEDVVASIWGAADGPQGDAPELPALDGFEALDAACRDAHRAGRYGPMIELARRARETTRDPEERARTWNREAGGWDGLGRFQDSMKAIQSGLRETPVSPEFRRMLQSNLANAYYAVWSLLEARAIAGDLLAGFAAQPAESLRDRKTHAFAHYVSGHALRRLIAMEPDSAASLAARARVDLVAARDRYRSIADETGDGSFAGIARTCAGGVLECDVATGDLGPSAAIDRFVDELDALYADDRELAVGDELESFGWWCIFGCNVALRGVRDERRLQSAMAIFTNKADEIAERLDHWAMRERVFTMEHTRRERSGEAAGFEDPPIVDENDVRIIAGTMARFPTFRETGWRILHTARFVNAI